MLSKAYFKIKARKFAKQTWAGSGKFGVFIVICIIIIATFKSLRLSKREKNIDLRSVQLIAVQLNLKRNESLFPRQQTKILWNKRPREL